MEQWQEIRRRHVAGQSERRIAQELGISRNTVSRAIKADGPPSYDRRSVIDPFAPWIDLIERGVRQGLRGSRVLNDLVAKGFTGSRTAFYRRFEAISEAQRAPKAAMRFETDPGEQAQFDWATYSLNIGERLQVVHVHSLLYCYSRRVHWYPSLRCNQPALFEALENGFRHFDGVCRHLVIDNPRAFVDRHSTDERRYNREFVAFCGHYSIHPIAATPRHPQTKGKVENGFGHLEELFLKGATWDSWGSFEQQLADFESTWNRRIHATTKAVPAVRFEEETLISLPSRTYFSTNEGFRHVSQDCLVSVDAVRYSVPWVYASKQVIIRRQQGRVLVVYSQSGQEVVRHTLQPSGSPPVICREHFTGLRQRQRAGLPTLIERFRQRYCRYGEAAEQFLQRAIARQHHDPALALARILELLSTVPDEIAVDALAEGVALNFCTRTFLQSSLQRRSRTPASDQAAPLINDPQLCIPDLDWDRPLEVYGQALDRHVANGHRG